MDIPCTVGIAPFIQMSGDRIPKSLFAGYRWTTRRWLVEPGLEQ